MTGANRTKNAEDSLALSRRAFSAAGLLAKAGLYDQAAARAYYGLFHAVRALLFTEGLEPRTHHGTHNLLHIHFVRPGTLDAEHLAALRDLERAREEADYMSAGLIEKDEYESLRKRADDAIEALEAVLAGRGVTLPG